MRKIQFQRLCWRCSYTLSSFSISKHQRFHLSSVSKSPRITQSVSQLENQQETSTNISSLFKAITAILGSDELVASKPFPTENELDGKELGSRTESVCENAEMNVLPEKETILIINMSETDVSSVVDKIAEVVRAEANVVRMEERLKEVGFVYEPEIVEKVLRKFSKVPQLAFRFFNWLKMKNEYYSHSTSTYNTMLYIAGEAKEFELVDQLLEQMENNCLCEKDIKTYTILISHYGKAKLISKVLTVFEEMRKSGCAPDAAAYKTMVSSLCSCGESEIAFEFYKEMVDKQMELDLGLYKLLINCLGKSGNIAAVRSVADYMKVCQIPENIVFTCVLKSYCIAGKIKEALELITELKTKETPFESVHFETLVKGLCRADKIADALEIVEIMKGKNMVDGKIYGIIINGYLMKNNIHKALELFENMIESGHLPTSATYTELMQQLFSLNEYRKGCELYSDLIKRGIELDCVAVTAMVAGHVRQDRIPEAWMVFKSMEDMGIRPSAKSYLVFIQELYKVSRMDEIIKVLNETRLAKEVFQQQVFDSTVVYLEKQGDKDDAEKVRKMRMVSEFGCQEEAESSREIHVERRGSDFCSDDNNRTICHNEGNLNEICRILRSSREWHFIEEALEKSTIAYTPELVVEILKKCKTHGKVALSFFSWVATKPGYKHTTDTYNMAIKISGQGKDFKHMRSLFFEMRRKGCIIQADTWTIMIMLYGRIGLTEIALKNFSDMKADGCNPNGSTYKYLILSLCGKKGKKVDDAINRFQEMIHAGYTPDKELVETYLDCLCLDGKLVEASKCVHSLCKIGFTVPLSYSMYIRALCRTGNLEEALTLVNEVTTDERSTLDKYVYGSIVHGLLSKGRTKEALDKVESMKQIGVLPTVHVYTSLIDHFFKEKKTEEALNMFKTMQQQESCEPTIVTYCALIRGLMDAGRVDDAWDIFNRIKVKGPQPGFKAYSIFITCLCKAGRSEEALPLLAEMQNKEVVPSTVNFRTIFYGLNREGKHEVAQTVLRQKSVLLNKRKLC